MSPADWFTFALIIFSATLGGILRRLSGFGGAMVMSPMLMGFFPLVSLIPLINGIELVGGFWLAKNWRVDPADRARLYRILAVAAISLPIGILIGMQFSSYSLKIVASCVVFLFSLYLLLKPYIKLLVTPIKDSIAGSGAGLLLGSCGFGGPVVALYLNASALEFKRARSLLSQVASGLALFAIITASFFGTSFAWVFWLLVGVPAFFLGIYIASRIDSYHLISESKIRLISIYFLMGSAIFNIAVGVIL